MSSKKSWGDLSPTQRRAVVAAAAGEIVATTWAARDLRRRAPAEVRGSKVLWGAALVVQPFGPLAYLAFGRR